MRYKARWHPCFLPTDFRERVKQYQAEMERGTDDRETGRETTADAEVNEQTALRRERSVRK